MVEQPVPGALNPDPGTLPVFGPPFVRFVDGRFAGLEKHLLKLGRLLERRDRPWRKVATGQTDGSGNLTLDVFQVPADSEFFLHRMYVNDGSTFASPTKTGGLSILVDGEEEDGISLTANGLPQVFTASSSAALVYGPGERVAVAFQSVTASKGVKVIARGRLIRSHTNRDEP